MAEPDKSILKGVIKPAIDDSSYELLVKEYSDVTSDLKKNPALTKFSEEYEKIMHALEKSHESEKRLMRKCRELKADMASNSVRLEQANKITSDDPQNIIALKKELEQAWNLVNVATEKENNARDRIKSLKQEIATLGKIIETGDSGVVGADTIAELTRAKEKLLRDSVEQASENAKLRAEVDKTKEEISELQNEIIAAQTKITDLSQDIQNRSVDAQREQKKKEKMEREMNAIRDDMNSKTEQIRSINGIIDRLQQDLHSKEEDNRVAKISLEQTNRALQVTDAKLSDAQSKLDSQMNLTESIRNENQSRIQEVKLKENEVAFVRGENSKLMRQNEAANRRIQSIEDKKNELEKERETLKDGIQSIERELDAMRRSMEADRKACEELAKERDVLSKTLVKMTSQTSKQVTLLRLHEQSRRNLEQEIINYKDEAQKQRKIITSLERERDRYINEASGLTQKVLEHMEEVKLREMQIFDFKKKIAEAQTKLKQQENLYEAVRSDRNLYSKNLIEAQDEISEMKRKLRIMIHQIAQLKDEIATKDATMVQENMERNRMEIERNNMNLELQRMKNLSVENRAFIDSQEAEERKLLKIISEADFERVKHKKELDQVISERDILGTQLVRRNDELALLYEKIRIQQSVLNQGESQYNRRLEDLRVVKMEIRKARREKAMLQASISKMDDLKKEVYRAQRELMQEQTRCKALEEELQNPINVHRWRKLEIYYLEDWRSYNFLPEGSDPSTFEMIQKIQGLQKRLIAKTEEVVEKELQIQEKEKLYVELKQILARQPGPEVSEQLNIYEKSLREKTKAMKAMNAEMNTYDITIKEYQIQIEKLANEMNDIKKAYFIQKRRKQIERQTNNKMTDDNMQIRFNCGSEIKPSKIGASRSGAFGNFNSKTFTN